MNKRTPTRLLKSGLNSAGSHHCATLINAGKVDRNTGALSDSDSLDANLFLGKCAEGSGNFCYPVVKDGSVVRAAVVEARAKAVQTGDSVIFRAAGQLLDQIDGTKNYSGQKALPMQIRAWAKFEIEKDVQETDDAYIIKGIATTPSTDRMGDIVEPDGCDINTDVPHPFLWQHDSDQPIGEVFDAKPTSKGIPIQVRIPKVAEDGMLKQRIENSVQEMRYGLVKGMSIGFSPIEYMWNDETGGIHFVKWCWLETSAVTIPANADAGITSIKSFDEKAEKRRKKTASRVSIKLTDEHLVDRKTVSKHALSQVNRLHVDSVNSLVVKDFIGVE